MKIKKIKILKNKVKVTLDDEVLELDKEIYPNFYLYVGKDLSLKEYKEIKEYNNVSSLLKYALRIRSKSIYSEFKMREKLYNKGADKKSVDKVIKTLKNYDLIDDNAFVQDLVSYYDSLNYGKNKIIQKLKDKGIFEEKICKINFSVSNERKKANNIFSKVEKKNEKYNFSQKKEPVYNAYLQLGFDHEIALNMKDKVQGGSIKEEKEKLYKDYLKSKMRLERKYKGHELKQKIIASLVLKGYKMGDVINLMSERK